MSSIEINKFQQCNTEYATVTAPPHSWFWNLGSFQLSGTFIPRELLSSWARIFLGVLHINTLQWLIHIYKPPILSQGIQQIWKEQAWEVLKEWETTAEIHQVQVRGPKALLTQEPLGVMCLLISKKIRSQVTQLCQWYPLYEELQTHIRN